MNSPKNILAEAEFGDEEWNASPPSCPDCGIPFDEGTDHEDLTVCPHCGVEF